MIFKLIELNVTLFSSPKVNWIEILNGNQIQIKVTKWIQIGGKSPVADI